MNLNMLDELQSSKSQSCFEPVVVDTDNIQQEINTFAATKGLGVDRISYKILKTNTFYRLAKEAEWIEAPNTKMFSDDEFFTDPNLEIMQNFKIEMYDSSDMSRKMVVPKVTVGANKSLTKIIITIHKNENLTYYSRVEEDIIDLINKRKIKSRILVGIRESTMIADIKKMIFSMRVSGALESDHEIVAMEGAESVEAISDELVFTYKKTKKVVDDNERVDHSKRNFVKAVAVGDVIIDYIKPQVGKNGRDCRGDLIVVGEPKVQNDKPINITENIERVEDDISVRYIARKSGYVNDKGGTYDIEEKMDLNEVDFKTTGSIKAGLDSNIQINLKEADTFKDAIGAGMSVESTEVLVDGNIGPQATIKARVAKIGGQTHGTSNIYADTLSIAVHRGYAEGVEANIDRVEGGTVVGDIIRVKSLVGGTLIGREIHIDELNSNATVSASELIEIKELKGNTNKLSIDTSSTKGFKEKIDSIKSVISSSEKELEKIPKLLENKKVVIEKNKDSVEMIKSRIEELRADGVQVPTTFVIKLKDYQQLVNEYNTMIRQAKEIRERVRILRVELNEIQSKIYLAKIVNLSPWKEFNEIKFKLVEPPVEIEYHTREGEMAKVISLKHDEDHKLYISRNS